jgi:hypothetical protein
VFSIAVIKVEHVSRDGPLLETRVCDYVLIELPTNADAATGLDWILSCQHRAFPGYLKGSESSLMWILLGSLEVHLGRIR